MVGPAQCSFRIAVGDKIYHIHGAPVTSEATFCLRTTSGVMRVDSLLRRTLAKILPAIERRDIPL